jgi:hypothetical protein
MESDVHDGRLWMPIARATGAVGNTSRLVGTVEQVADALLRYLPAPPTSIAPPGEPVQG